MTILKNFDMDSIRKARARAAARGGVNLVEAIDSISPDIAKLKIGETAQLAVPKGVSLRKHVMQIVAKLNNLTPQGGDWAGRQYDVVSDGDATVYVQRGEDLKGSAIPVRKRRGGGRRPAGTSTAGGGDTANAGDGATVTTH